MAALPGYRVWRPLSEIEGEIMEKKIAGLLGAMATLGAFNAAQAAPTPAPAPSDVLRANSFAELLEPIPNAAALLKAVDEAPAPSADENVKLAQYYHHHHHHHHHSNYRRYGPVVVVPGYRRYYRHHHHHHHHHHSFYRRDW
jgi:hypothetical protein